MKLKNKLIPLVAISATAGVVAPLVTITSCGQSSMKTYDLFNDGYEYDQGSMSVGSYGTDQATDLYFKDVQNNPEIFRADVVNKYYYQMLEIASGFYEGTDQEIKSFKVSASLPTFGKTTVSYPTEGEFTYPTVSFEMKLEIEIETTPISTVTDTIVHTKTMKLVNVPFSAYTNAYLNPNNTNWMVGIGELLLNHKYLFKYMTDDWSVDASYKTVRTIATDGDPKKDVTMSNDSISLKQYIDIDSHANSFMYGYGDNVWYQYANEYRWSSTSPIANTFDFESTYMYTSQVAAEVIADHPIINYKVAKLGTFDEGLPVQIGGFYITNKNIGTTKWTVTNPITCYGYYRKGSSEAFTLNIQAGAKVTVKSDGEVIIGDTTAADVVVQTTSLTESIKISTDASDQLSNSIYFNFPKILTLTKSSSGEVVKENVYTDVSTGLIAQFVRNIDVEASHEDTYTPETLKIAQTTYNGALPVQFALTGTTVQANWVNSEDAFGTKTGSNADYLALWDENLEQWATALAEPVFTDGATQKEPWLVGIGYDTTAKAPVLRLIPQFNISEKGPKDYTFPSKTITIGMNPGYIRNYGSSALSHYEFNLNKVKIHYTES